MFFFNSYLNNVVKHDLINKFFYTNLKQIPKLETIVLNFGYQNSNFKHLISGLLALELFTSKKKQADKI